ncbi:MAG: hypothetical protein CMH83_02275 [Nocardioides sp.]|nr:hypothetical protein [Nocardioides sp.]
MPEGLLTCDDTPTGVGLVAAVRDAAHVEQRAQLGKARAVLEWVASRQLPADRAVAEWSDERLGQMGRDRFGSQALHLAGPGAPALEEDEAYEIAASLGLSRQSGCRYVGDLIELRYRLPRVWSRVVALDLPLWKARTIASATVVLPLDGAAYVDAQLAWAAVRTTVAQIERTVGEAIARYAPDLLSEDPAEELDVRLGFDLAGVGTGVGARVPVEGLLDLDDALDLEDALRAGAAALKDAGCDDPLGARRAKALGDLARGQSALDLQSTGTVPEKRPLVVNVVNGQATCEAFVRPGHPVAVTVDQVRGWCATSTSVTVREVLDLTCARTTASYAPTAYIAAQARWRHPTCVFPGCGVPSAHADLDHIEPYASGGKTTADNLAPLCRRHHRMKTHTRWRYRRRPDGVLEWTGPMGQMFTVDDRWHRHPPPDPGTQ